MLLSVDNNLQAFGKDTALQAASLIFLAVFVMLMITSYKWTTPREQVTFIRLKVAINRRSVPFGESALEHSYRQTSQKRKERLGIQTWKCSYSMLSDASCVFLLFISPKKNDNLLRSSESAPGHFWGGRCRNTGRSISRTVWTTMIT